MALRRLFSWQALFRKEIDLHFKQTKKARSLQYAFSHFRRTPVLTGLKCWLQVLFQFQKNLHCLRSSQGALSPLLLLITRTS